MEGFTMTMGNYYLDVETTGLDPGKHEIITIQYQELDVATGKPVGNLTILKAWESSEKEIITKFLSESFVKDTYPFSFVAVGYNLARFDRNFLRERARVHKIPISNLLAKPFIDLVSAGILMNKGQVKGCGLDKLTGKEGQGSLVPVWYANKQHQEIINYIEGEAAELIKFNSWLCKEMPLLLERFKKEVLHK